MLFKDAIVQLQGRIPMHRTGWNPQDGYIILMPGMAYIWKIVLQPAPNAGNYIFSLEDFLAEDWEVYTPPLPCIEEEKAPEAPETPVE
jgi:hypothetical protein